MKLISFVIPVYRNEISIRPTYSKLIELMKSSLSSEAYEMLFIDDGSDDGSPGELASLSKDDPNVKILTLSRNFGQVAAVLAGLREAKGDAMVVLSADLQEPIELVAGMIKDWKEGNEIVIGYRVSREDSFTAAIASRIFYGLIRLAVPRMPTGGFDFILLDRKPGDILKNLKERNRFFQGDVLWLGFKTKFIPYHRQKRFGGKSQWTLFKKIKYFIDGFLSTSYLAIRMMSLIGVMVATSGFSYAIAIVYARLVYQEAPKGWAPVMVALLLLGGLIMLTLGIIGEYIWRIYDETRQRPMYILSHRSPPAVVGEVHVHSGDDNKQEIQ